MNFGSGGMEVERQVIEHLLSNRIKTPVIFIGVDTSDATKIIAKENLKIFGDAILIKEEENIDQDYLESLLKNVDIKPTIILCKNNIFTLLKVFRRETVHLIYHSLFKHHLSNSEKRDLDIVSEFLSKNSIEYDGYKSWFHIVFSHTIMGWHDPVFLNATILSDLRYFTKRELRQHVQRDRKLRFFAIGTYMLEHRRT